MTAAVLGIDAGGTTSRAVVVGRDGALLARVTDAGANRWSSDRDPAAAIGSLAATAVDAAGSSDDPARIVGAVVAIAGSPERLRRELAASWPGGHDRLGPTPRVVADVHASYAAGTPSPDGAVLAAGTGAIAAAFAHGNLTRRIDGHGWLLGDRGSAVWLGIRAVRAVLAAEEGTGAITELRDVVRRELLDGSPGDDLTAATIGAVYGGAPASLGRLAPAVLACAAAGDAVATGIVDDAVHELARTLVAAAPEPPPVVVLAGSVLEQNPDLRERVLRAAAERGVAAPAVLATDGAAGAAFLALTDAGHVTDPAALHARLCAPTPLADPTGSAGLA